MAIRLTCHYDGLSHSAMTYTTTINNAYMICADGGGMSCGCLCMSFGFI